MGQNLDPAHPYWTITELPDNKKLVKFDVEYAVWEDIWFNLPREEGTTITKIDNNSFMIEKSA